jgi:N-methylhydantoinase A
MVLGRRAKLALPHLPKGKSVKERERRQVYFASSSPTDTPVYNRDTLPAGIEIEGPALINEYGSTTVIFAGDKLKVADTGELMITLGSV